MASSPVKRRKLSPDPQNALSAPSTPSRMPPSRDTSKASNSRPSFASPTKASIARHNPQLLAKSSSTAVPNPTSSGKENVSQAASTEALFITPSGPKYTDMGEKGSQDIRADLSQGDKESQVEAGVIGPTVQETPTPSVRMVRSAAGSLAAPPRRKSRTPGKEAPRVPETTNAPGRTTDSGQADLSLPSDRTIPPVPFRSAGLRRSPLPAQGLESQNTTRAGGPNDPEEPELPPTPVERGLADPIVTTPPSGIHNTPSKRSKRLRGTKPKSSPLKPQPEIVVGRDVTEAEPELERNENGHIHSELATRHLEPIDQHAEKKKIRDEILKELQQLQADVAIAEQETERHRRYYFSRRGPAEARNPEEILGVLRRSMAENPPVAQPPKSTSVFAAIGSFLPFARRPRPPISEIIKDTPLSSHLPVVVEDQLPYLQVFTPLKLESTITLLPSKPSATSSGTTSSTIFQNHDVSLSAPSGLFSARLNFTVDTSRLSISSLSINSLEASAEAELGRWVRGRASGKGILGRDVNAICWAMSRWYELATRRAKFWCEIERKFGNESGRKKLTARLKLAGTKRKRGYAAVVEETDEAGDAAGDADSGNEGTRRKWTRKEILPQMRRTVLVLRGEGAELRIQWGITFDWTGEAESAISASARVPSSWQDADERGSLAKIPETFDELVKARGPMVAVRAMVALLMPS